MTRETDAIVVGGGVGAICSAVLLGGSGLRVKLFESASSLGGKAGIQEGHGVAFDTGPSVLTLPDVFDEVFSSVGLSFRDQVNLLTPEPGFRYLFPDGTCLDVFHELERTIESTRTTLGELAAEQLQRYLKHSKRVWDAAAPHFVFDDAPSVKKVLFGGMSAWGALGRIGAFSKMGAVIDDMVVEPHLRKLLKRYATYNGSDVRTAPSTLGCIAHVELALGGYGIEGGMYELIEALKRALDLASVDVHLGAKVERIECAHGRAVGVLLEDGRSFAANSVVFGGDASALAGGILSESYALPIARGVRSMSAHTALLKAARPVEKRAAHTVIFPDDYEKEFSSIFDEHRVPAEPTIYLCDQEACHLRTSWLNHSPVFCMINAPAVSVSYRGDDRPTTEQHLRLKLQKLGLARAEDECLWWRTPADLNERFSASQGALYGLSSNDMQAAFRRPANRTKIKGLYLAGGTAHPGGGLPMVAQSGKLAAAAVLKNHPARPARAPTVE